MLLTTLTIAVALHPAIVSQEFLEVVAPSCHASTITETSSGRLLCAWFAGTKEKDPDVGIWLSILEESWSHPRIVAQVSDFPCWNPVLFTMPSNEVLLFFKAGSCPEQWEGHLRRSYDEGETWSESEDLPSGIFGPIKNKPLLLADGTLLVGSSIESWRRWSCFIDITPDGGRTWTKGSLINAGKKLFSYYGIIQPTLFYDKEGKIQMLARSRNIGYICKSESSDLGKTWTRAVPIDLPNPNAAIDVVNLQDGRVALAYNHSKEKRSPLNLAISQDGGKTWDRSLVLEDQPGEYSYPSIIQTKDGMIHITYTWRREKIKHVAIDPKFL